MAAAPVVVVDEPGIAETSKQTKPELGVAVFARTPGSGGKSRLAAGLGVERTSRFYEHCLRCAGQWLGGGPVEVGCYWALTGPGGHDQDYWRGGTVLEQGSGGLGERMHRIASLLHARHRLWCLVGTDIPQMPALAELDLAGRLTHSDFVVGPSADGGFWLIAGRHPLPRRAWIDITYSQADTLEWFLTNIQRECRDWLVDTDLPVLTDIDGEADLSVLLADLQSGEPMLDSAQRRLLVWLREVTGTKGE